MNILGMNEQGRKEEIIKEEIKNITNGTDINFG